MGFFTVYDLTLPLIVIVTPGPLSIFAAPLLLSSLYPSLEVGQLLPAQPLDSSGGKMSVGAIDILHLAPCEIPLQIHMKDFPIVRLIREAFIQPTILTGAFGEPV